MFAGVRASDGQPDVAAPRPIGTRLSSAQETGRQACRVRRMQLGLLVDSIICLNTSMIQALASGASHPVVAGLLGLGTAGLAGAVVATAWSVYARQIRLAELLARRQFTVTGETGAAAPAANGTGSPAANGTGSPAGNGTGSPRANGHGNAGAVAQATRTAAGPGLSPPVVIDGPDTVVTGEQARYRVRPADGRTVVSWAAGGGPVAHSPDPAHPDELLLIADQPGDSRSPFGCARA